MVGPFVDYFRHISEFEPTRASQYGIRHYCWLAVNPKESENVQLSREVISRIPEFLDGATAIGIGEIGLNKNTQNELTIFREQLELALRYEQLILIHTPHLGDKLKGTQMTLDLLRELALRVNACGSTTWRSIRSNRCSMPATGPGSHALSDDQDVAAPGRGHPGATRHRTDHGQLFGPLGSERPVPRFSTASRSSAVQSHGARGDRTVPQPPGTVPGTESEVHDEAD